MAASPAPAQPNPEMQTASRRIIGLVQETRAIAQQFPETAPLISQINDLLRQIVMKVMSKQPPGEPAAPPNG